MKAAAVAVLSESGSEADVQHRVATLLQTFGALTKLGYQTGEGPADIAEENLRLLVETKEPGGASDPHGPGTGSQPGESAFGQLDRYARAVIRKDRGSLPVPGREVPWLGIVTDGRHWHGWAWSTASGTSQPYQGSAAFTRGQETELLAWLFRFVNRAGGKPTVPDDPHAQLFAPYLPELVELAAATESRAGRQGRKSLETQWRLWWDMLRGSGMAPREEDSKDLFCRHTFLVAVARAVIAALTEGGKATPVDLMSSGFVSWTVRTPQGEEWTRRLFEAADRFDWRARPRDVLREMYGTVIDKEHRKMFGEYYTPDWLAEMVTERVLSDEWCQSTVIAAERGTTSGIGVLDPACGSGTFLYHAARRLCSFASGRGWTDTQISGIAASLVHGIDIHPVAVEIAKATLLRALPAAPPAGLDNLSVYQGDALLSSAGDKGGLLSTSEVGFEIDTPGGRAFMIPKAFARRPGLGQRLKQLVDGACRQQQAPRDHLLMGLSLQDAKYLVEAHTTLVEVIREEGNGVWAWFAHNQIAASLLANDKVDRIVANPPWVRMSDIQVAGRKEWLEETAKAEGLWGGRSTRHRVRHRRFVHQTMRRQIPPKDGKRRRVDRQPVFHPGRKLGKVPRMEPVPRPTRRCHRFGRHTGAAVHRCQMFRLVHSRHRPRRRCNSPAQQPQNRSFSPLAGSPVPSDGVDPPSATLPNRLNTLTSRPASRTRATVPRSFPIALWR